MTDTTTESKPWKYSKTIIAGTITTLSAVVTAYLTKPDWKLACIAGLGVLMVFLRTQTTLPLGK